MVYDIVIIGGGASGMVAAINAARKRCSVVICERLPVLGKKILACGGGRCNLSHDRLDESTYNQEARPLVKSVFKRFGEEQSAVFFQSIGLRTYTQEGRVFPVTDQASSVLKVLEMELNRLNVTQETHFDVIEVKRSAKGFDILSRSRKSVVGKKLIFAAGGRSYPALGSNGSCYEFAVQLGHHIVPPVPSAVPLVLKDQLCHFLQGQKIPAHAKAFVGDIQVAEASGEILFTKYGLSGTAILDVSEPISIALHRHGRKDIFIEVDMVPFLTRDDLERELLDRSKKGIAMEDILAGFLPNKWGLISKHTSLQSLPDLLKSKRFTVLDTRGWNEAEFTAGGISVEEVREETLESKIVPQLFFCGEILDVQGKRGGYNLAWAWASGWVAGDGC